MPPHRATNRRRFPAVASSGLLAAASRIAIFWQASPEVHFSFACPSVSYELARSGWMFLAQIYVEILDRFQVLVVTKTDKFRI